jgi:uncharacterized coiled-coil protein SlyX
MCTDDKAVMEVPYVLMRERNALKTCNESLVKSVTQYNFLPHVNRCTMESLREISDKLHFPIMPFECINPAAVSTEYKLRSIIPRFVSNCNDIGYKVYVLAPINTYSIIQQVKAESKTNIVSQFYSKQFASNFETISMTIPMLIMLSARLDEVESALKDANVNIASLNKEVASVVLGMKNMQAKLDSLQESNYKYYNNTMSSYYGSSSDTSWATYYPRKRTAQEQFEHEIHCFWDDPLMFAIPREAKLADYEGRVLVGPCWGRPADPKFFEAFGFKKNNDTQSYNNSLYNHF